MLKVEEIHPPLNQLAQALAPTGTGTGTTP